MYRLPEYVVLSEFKEYLVEQAYNNSKSKAHIWSLIYHGQDP